MNVEIGAEAALFPEKEYIKGIFVAVCQSVYVQSSELVPLPPWASVSSPLDPKEGEQHSLRGEGVGTPIRTTGYNACRSVYSMMHKQHNTILRSKNCILQYSTSICEH